MAKELTGTLSVKSHRISGDIDSKTAQFEAELPGSLKVVSGVPGPPGKTPVKGVDYFTDDDIAEIVREVRESYSGEVDVKTDETLIMKNGILSVNTTDLMEKDNTLPITSAGVFATVGNIEALLNTI